MESAPFPRLSVAGKRGFRETSGEKRKKKKVKILLLLLESRGARQWRSVLAGNSGVGVGGYPGARPAPSAHLALKGCIRAGRDRRCGRPPVRSPGPAIRNRRGHFCACCLAPPGAAFLVLPPELRRDEQGMGFGCSPRSTVPGGPQR